MTSPRYLMNRNSGSGAVPGKKSSPPQEASEPRIRPGLLIGTLLVAVTILAIVVGRGGGKGPHALVDESAAGERTARQAGEAPSMAGDPAEAWRRAKPGGSASPASEPTAKPAQGEAENSTPRVEPVAPDSLGQASPDSLRVLNSLTQLKLTGGRLTAEQASQWKESLKTLIAMGTSALPAIRDFLRSGTTLDFGAAGWRSVGYSSVREAMADALARIGGPEALGVTLEALEGNRNPREIAMLAQALEAQAPEQQREAALRAARSVLSAARDGELPGRDVAPIFEILEKYGGKDAIADLEQSAGQWKYYSTMALAQLPDGAGVPSLARMVVESKGSDIPAIQALASLSTRSAEAREVLLTQAQQNRIGPSVWPYLAQALNGDELQVADSVFDRVLTRSDGKELQTTHIQFGNQNFYRAPTIDSLSPDQLLQQVALLDQFVTAAGSNPSAVKALQQTRDLLQSRLESSGASGQKPPP